MKITLLSRTALAALLFLSVSMTHADTIPATYDVKAYGATGDGTTLDTAAINKAIAAASTAGGGTVRFPAGTYLSHSVRLASNITLYLDPGATLMAADPSSMPGDPGYDAPEPNPEARNYQDFGHSHWQNSLLWGIGLQNVTIAGPGLINGRGLNRGDPTREGTGNKAIALKLCRNVVLRDFSLLNGGHFGLLATGVDNMTINNIRVDTNRDALDIDCCRNVRISDSQINSCNDDGIVLKSSYGLGFARDSENIAITNCQVSGFDPGTLLDGTYGTTQTRAPDGDGPTGRIKFGTESNGGFKNIAISNCVFVHCRGLALETVDGGVIEDITISNIAMRDIFNSPIFIRLGNRARGPQGTPVGAVRRVNISNVVASDVDPRYPILIAGLVDHPVEDVSLSNIRILSRGGLTMTDIAQQTTASSFFNRGGGANFQRGAPTPGLPGAAPAGGAAPAAPATAAATPAAPAVTGAVPADNAVTAQTPPAGGGGRRGGGGGGRGGAGPRDPYQPPEAELGYPEPSMFGLLPSYGMYARHVKNLTLVDVNFSYANADERAPVMLDDVSGIEFVRLKAQRNANVPYFVLRGVKNLVVLGLPDAPDTRRDSVDNGTL